MYADPKYSGGCCARLVGYPLPTDAATVDAMTAIPPPAFEDDGRVRSRYCMQNDFGKLGKNVLNTSDWLAVKDDAVFHFKAADSTVIPVEEWMELRERIITHQSETDVEREDGEWTQESNIETNGQPNWDVMDSLEHVLNKGNGTSDPDHASAYYTSTLVAKLPPTGETCPEISFQDSKMTTEDKLAALGVTGAPKPVRGPARPYIAPEPYNEWQEGGSQSMSSDRHGS